MKKLEKKKLISQAGKLYILGLQIEKARAKLKSIVLKGYAYNSPEIINTLEKFNDLELQWKQLEAEHLKYREKIMK